MNGTEGLPRLPSSTQVNLAPAHSKEGEPLDQGMEGVEGSSQTGKASTTAAEGQSKPGSGPTAVGSGATKKALNPANKLLDDVSNNVLFIAEAWAMVVLTVSFPASLPLLLAAAYLMDMKAKGGKGEGEGMGAASAGLPASASNISSPNPRPKGEREANQTDGENTTSGFSSEETNSPPDLVHDYLPVEEEDDKRNADRDDRPVKPGQNNTGNPPEEVSV